MASTIYKAYKYLEFYRHLQCSIRWPMARKYNSLIVEHVLRISVLKCGMMKPDGIIDEMFVLGVYPKWKDRSIDK